MRQVRAEDSGEYRCRAVAGDSSLQIEHSTRLARCSTQLYTNPNCSAVSLLLCSPTRPSGRCGRRTGGWSSAAQPPSPAPPCWASSTTPSACNRYSRDK